MAELSLVDNDLRADDACDGPVAVAGDRGVEPHRVLGARHVELPTQPDESEAPLEQEIVAKFGAGPRIARGGAAVEHGEHALVASIRDFVQGRSVSILRIARLEQGRKS